MTTACRKLQEAPAPRAREQRPHRPPQQARLPRLHALQPRRGRALCGARKRVHGYPGSSRRNASRNEGPRPRTVRLPRRPRQDAEHPACARQYGRNRPSGMVDRRDVDNRATRACRGVPSRGRPPGRVRQTAGALWCVASRVWFGVVCAGGCQRVDRLGASGATLLPSTACSESTSSELPVYV